LTNPDNLNIINFDLWKQAAGGRHQIGTLAGFKSEQVAGFLLECMAGFVGIRSGCRAARLESRRRIRKIGPSQFLVEPDQIRRSANRQRAAMALLVVPIHRVSELF